MDAVIIDLGLVALFLVALFLFLRRLLSADETHPSFEQETANALARLDARCFRVYNDIILPDGEGGTTQIDHLVVCSGGLYFIESKGWGERIGATKCDLYAEAGSPSWKIYYKGRYGRPRGSAFANNPLRQNYKHHICLSEALGIPRETIHPMVVLPDNCRLMRGAVVTGLFLGVDKLVANILQSAHGKVYTTEKIKDIIVRLNIYQTATTQQAAEAHAQRLRQKFSGITCPRCGAQLMKRVAKRDGHIFLGCSAYPKCRYMRQCR